MSNPISRRNFLKGGAAAAAGVAVSRVPLPQAVRAAGGDTLCTVLDIGRCIGCEECVAACREQWQDTVLTPKGPIPKMFPAKVPVEDWTQRKDVQDRLTPYNFLYVEHLDIPHKGEEKELHVPRRCMHCQNPPCTNLCPFGAGRMEENGIVHIDPEVCLGGSKCKSVCPWHIPQRQSGVGIYLHLMPAFAGNGVMFKCHRCLPLIEQGKTPRCIEVCPEQIQSIGKRDQMAKKAVELAKEYAQKDGAGADKYGDYLYGLAENGGTGTIYVSSIPFKLVNQAIIKMHKEQAEEDREADKKAGRRPERGNLGRPPMGPAANSMQSAENLTLALAVAPVAGAAAGLARLFGKVKKALPDEDAPAEDQKGGRP